MHKIDYFCNWYATIIPGGNKKLILMYAQSVRYTVKNTDNLEQKIDKKSQQL